MTSFKINVNKQVDGYSFSIAPSIREFIKKLFPNAHPANNIFVSYDTKSDFDLYYGKLENSIYPALLGIDDSNDLKKIDEIEFVDAQTGNTLHKVTSPLAVFEGDIKPESKGLKLSDFSFAKSRQLLKHVKASFSDTVIEERREAI